MKTYTKHDYEYGDLVVMVLDSYLKINKGEVGIIKERWGEIANIQFANTSGAFPYSHFMPLEATCK